MSAHTRFHTRLALHGLRQFAASLKSSVEVVLLAAGQVILMALALLAWPLLQTALWLGQGWPWQHALALWLGYSALMTLPVFLLRKRLLPQDVVLWCRCLPVTKQERWRAHFGVMRLFIVPLMIAYGISFAACMTQMDLPPAILPAGLLLVASSILLTWVLGALLLFLRQHDLAATRARWWLRLRPRQHARRTPDALPYRPRLWRPRLLQYWYRFFFLPFWRLENGIGLQQTLLFFATGAMFWLWQHAQGEFVRFLFCIAASSLSLILTDRGDKAVQEQVLLLQPHCRTLPLRLWPVAGLAKLLSALPTLVILLLFAHWLRSGPAPAALALRAGVVSVYFGTQLLAQACIIGIGHLSTAGRARIVILFMVVLAAIGSELWK
jgi:hypothetical protein